MVQQVRFRAPKAGFDPWSERNYDPHAPHSTEKGRTGGGAEGTPPEINRGRPVQQPASPPRSSPRLHRTPVLLTLRQARTVPPPLSSLPPAHPKIPTPPCSTKPRGPPSLFPARGKAHASPGNAHTAASGLSHLRLSRTHAPSHILGSQNQPCPHRQASHPGLGVPPPAGRRPLQHTGKCIRLAHLYNFPPTSILAAPPGTRPRGLVPPHPPLPRWPLQENGPRKHPRCLLEAHHVKWVSGPPGPPNLPPQAAIPTRERPDLRGSQAAPPRLPGLCAALGGHSDALCRGPAHPGLLATLSHTAQGLFRPSAAYTLRV